MKKGTVGIFLFIVFFVGVVRVAGAQSYTLPDPGLTPESPFYFLDLWDESIRLFFTFRDESVFEQRRGRVEERLAEADALAGRGISATQRSLELYREELPHFYAAAHRSGQAYPLPDSLRMATEHLSVLDHISERTNFDKKQFILHTKQFLIIQQLRNIEAFAKSNSEEAIRVYAAALMRRMDRLREVAIDKENNIEALNEYILYLIEIEKLVRTSEDVFIAGESVASYLQRTVMGHEETLLGHVRDRIPLILEDQLLLAVNTVRKVSGLLPRMQLPPRNNIAETEDTTKEEKNSPPVLIEEEPVTKQSTTEEKPTTTEPDPEGDIAVPPPPVPGL